MNLNMMTRIALMTALTVVGSAIRIPLGPVPMTLNTFFAALSGLLLGASGGAWSQGLYVIIGLLGVPVFSFGGGLSSVVHPTFGFIIGYVVCAVLCGRLLRDGASSLRTAVAVLAGLSALYGIGLSWLWYAMNYVVNVEMSVAKTLYVGCLVFIPGELVKGVALVFIVSRVRAAFSEGEGPAARHKNNM